MIVEGLNCKYETIGEEDDFPGVSNVKEMPLLVTTDIRLVDPSTDRGAEVRWEEDENLDWLKLSVGW